MNTVAPEQKEQRRHQSLNIINALRRGTVPADGLERIVVGLDVEESIISRQLDYVADGGGDLKFVRGDFGSGKTFFVARALEIAGSKGFATAHVFISPSAPLSKPKALYQQICANLKTIEAEHALKTIVDNWIFAIEERLISTGRDFGENAVLEATTEKEIESALAGISETNTGLAAALRAYYRANNAGDFPIAQAAIGWIAAESTIGRDFKQKAGIKGEVDDSSAFSFLLGLVEIIHGAGYQGLAIAIDELETTQGLQRNQRERSYQTLTRIIDALDGGRMPHCYFLFTGTPSFFDSSRGIRSVTPLYDRIKVNETDNYKNPRQPQIQLSRFDNSKLEMVALKVIDVYSLAYREVDRERVSYRFIRAMIKKLTNRFGGRVDIIPRIFLKEFIDVLDKCEIYEEYNPADAYEFDAEHLKGELKAEEEAVIVVEF
ncbi:BREX system ATP-binding protein BrxD [Methanoregula sp.]|jgi:adenosylhomocysteinase|uniref:BREX system ATP-binding protein BrxD n=1 Tax=Methanoregula sp. TaxID=2052170 RepID=UPI003C18D50D